jgi:spore maturation protein CgeB
MNTELIKFAKDKQYDWVWIDKGIWIYRETVKRLKRKAKTLVIHYTPDPAIVWHKTRHFIRSIPWYDILITTKTYEIEQYKKNGAKHIIFVRQGYDPDIFRPHDIDSELCKQLESDVCFVGHCERHYYRRVRAISKVVTNIAAWGTWGRCAMLHPWFKRVYRGGCIWNADYAKALCCTKIGLGLLSKLAPDCSTTRTYEITACGTFMLAERTDEHLELFEEGKEAEFFESDEELLNKVKFYLAHDEQREKIARAGRERCLRSGYSNHDRMKEVLDKITATNLQFNKHTVAEEQ